jgi:hypothetical protein
MFAPFPQKYFGIIFLQRKNAVAYYNAGVVVVISKVVGSTPRAFFKVEEKILLVINSKVVGLAPAL